ncbi:phytoene desaturase [Methylopila turkensis]|uniref:Phytoene dehydrogenase n=1 Tax=Methylopila turkensis TaxID=1437816 RepID=A0A9W6JKW7_9HYPH|nr:phytoene desaturase [Methylopila turkensis]GLK78276.1 phytoene desaturase [Methylopila turkensis]
MSDGSASGFDPRPSAVVIGAGFGGLAAAVRLGARGYRVTVLERLDQPGGRARTHRQDGFTFDAGPTIVTAPFLFEDLWSLAGRRMADDLTLAPLDPFYRIRFHDGSTFDCSGDAQAMRGEVNRLSPRDLAGYERFLAFSEELCRVGFEQLGDRPFSSFSDMIRVAPKLVRLQAYRSVYGLVAGFVKDERLRQALSFHPLFVGGDPFHAPSLYALIAFLERRWGVHYAMGGVGKLVDGLVRLINGQGGRVALRADVERIVVEGGRATGVRLKGGETVSADVVVSNADSAFAYGSLLGSETRRRWTDRKLAAARYSMSLFVWYFGTRKTYPDLPHHLILMGPRYRGLLDDIFRSKRLSDDFSLYLHRPTATDPSMAPKGCDCFYVLAPVPNLQGATDWTTEAECFRKKIEQSLSESVLPGLADAIVTSRVATPLTFRDDFSSPHGAAFGLEPVLTQSAWFRPHNVSEEFENLYLVGAGVHPGAGLPGVLSSAKILDKVVPHGSTLIH